MALTVVLSLAAIETHANDVIGRLPEDAMVEVPTRVAGKRVAVMRNKAAMDRLRLAEKLSRAVPLLETASESIKGTKPWQDFKRLNGIRNGSST